MCTLVFEGLHLHIDLLLFQMTETNLGQRMGPMYIPVEEEVESLHLKFLAAPPNGNFSEAVFRFNNCVQYRSVFIHSYPGRYILSIG